MAQELQASRPDGLLLVMFYNRSLDDADLILQTAEELGLPTVFFIGLGVKHGAVGQYRRPGVYFIQSLDNFDAIEYGVRMINTKKLLGQSKLLSITEAPEPREGVESVLRHHRPRDSLRTLRQGVRRREARFGSGRADRSGSKAGPSEIRGVTQEALENAARAHFALKKLLADEGADGLTMNCLRRGMLKPCMSFATLNGQLIPAACENDLGGRLHAAHRPTAHRPARFPGTIRATTPRPTTTTRPTAPAPRSCTARTGRTRSICSGASPTPTKGAARSRSSGPRASR